MPRRIELQRDIVPRSRSTWAEIDAFCLAGAGAHARPWSVPLCTAAVLFSFDLDKVLLAITKTERLLRCPLFSPSLSLQSLLLFCALGDAATVGLLFVQKPAWE